METQLAKVPSSFVSRPATIGRAICRPATGEPHATGWFMKRSLCSASGVFHKTSKGSEAADAQS